MPRPTRRLNTMNTPRRCVLVAIAAGLAASIAPAYGADDGDSLPIRSITLYRSGVGAFERSGTVTGDANVQLRFDADQMNDILKSMVLVDLDGGRIGSIGYGSKEPLAKRLASFAVDISDNPSMATLMGRLRGAPVRLDRGSMGDPLTGTVVGVEVRQTPTEAGSISEPFITLLTDTGMRSLAMSQIEGFEILDARLAEELRLALTALAEHRTDTTKTVDISLRGSGQRRVVAAYVHEAPVWKTSYRLVLDDDADAMMQGWAIVENTTDEDWTDVRLSLVAGRPVSFVMDLYQPLFLARPNVRVPVMAGVGPKVYDDGRAFAERATAGVDRFADKARPAASPPRESARARGGGGLYALDLEESDMMADARAEVRFAAQDMSASMAAATAATGGEVGELFQYQLDVPVTIERRRSAMLPILTGEVEARRVSIYDGSGNATGEHPMRGVEIENTSGLQLMPGPISVYDESTYAGDAQIGHVSAGDERLLAYAVDLDMRVEAASKGAQRVSLVTIVDGAVRERVEERLTTTYTASSNDQDDARTLIIEHPKRTGYEFFGDAEPTETTSTRERFELEIEAGGQSEIAVNERRTVYRSIAINSYNMERLAAYVRGGEASRAVMDAMNRAIELQRAVSAAQGEVNRLEQERAAIFQDQKRIRDNLARLDRNSDYAKRLVRKLDTQESTLEQLIERTDEAQDAVRSAEQSLQNYLHDLDVE